SDENMVNNLLKPMPTSNSEACPCVKSQTEAVIQDPPDTSISWTTKRGDKRRRAAQACLACRKRKVRCDVTVSGMPCLNCRLDGQGCVVKSRGWEKPKYLLSSKEEVCLPKPRGVMSPSYYLDPEQGDRDASTSTSQPPPTTEETVTIESPEQSINLIDTYMKSLVDHKSDTWTNTLDPLPEFSVDAIRGLWSDKKILSPPKCRGTKPKTTALDRMGSFVLFPFYRFVEHPSFWEVDADAAKLLEQRGCLHVPAQGILEEFMQNYFLYFHPLVPLLDEKLFWESYNGQSDTDGYISLFVLQAMLFVSCPYVSLESLALLGFCTVKEARAEFYSRAKLLCDFQTLFDLQSTPNDQARAQGALMLTYRAVSFNDKSPAYWLGIAIHCAKCADAHRDHGKNDAQDSGSLKRLWWCCVLRDRILALALRQSPLITLTAYDFSRAGLSFSDFAHEIRASRVYDATAKRVIVQVAIVLCHLGVILSDIPPALNLSIFQDNGGHGLSHEEIEHLAMRLDSWYDKTYVIFRLPSLITGAHESLIIFSNVLYTYYHAAKALLYNHALLGTASPRRGQLEQNHIDTRLEAHANLGRISFAATPFIWYLLQSQMQTSDNQTLDMQQDLQSHLDIMNRFSHLYENAESTIDCIKDIVEHIKINEPLPPPHGNGAPQHELDADCFTMRRPALIKESWGDDTWRDILLRDPQKYLRIVLTVEFSLARGRCPSEEDFPQSLRSLQQRMDTPCWGDAAARGTSDSDLGWVNEVFDDTMFDYDEKVL
ncbi:hypothetical protein KAF25_001970, partial [Fusarium avenaceum]